MKRFLLFHGMWYYPRGGWADFVGSYDSEEEAKTKAYAIVEEGSRWFHVVDSETRKITFSDARKDCYNAPQKWESTIDA